MKQGDIFERVRSRKITTLNIQVTSSCNYACGMCPFHGEGYSGKYFGERPSLKRYMTLEEIEKILQKARIAELEWIDLTPNGEFFTHKQWHEILCLIKQYGFKTTITSNGGLLEEGDIKKACEAGIDHITISIDSVDYEVYKKVRKPATLKAFNRAIQAPILFRKYGGSSMYIQVQITEQPDDSGGARDVLEFYKDKGLNQISLNKMFISSDEHMEHIGADKVEYIHGTCKSYGNPIVMTDGKVIPCCGGFYFYPKIEGEIPNILDDSSLWGGAMDRIDDLYEHNEVFKNYCQNCSLYATHNSPVSEKTIFGVYYAEKSALSTRYFLLPLYLRWLPNRAILWLYRKGHAGKIKRFISRFKKS